MKENAKIKVTAFVGSARKKHTYDATELFLKKLKSFGNIESEIVRLSDYDLGTCKGCRVCFDQGEEFCQFKDDRDKLIEKIMNSDGVIFASPNYSFQVSALMKIFLDRLGFVFHRPRFFGIAFTSIVAQGIYGGSKIVKYFNFIGDALGFNVVKGCCIRSLEPITEKGRKKIDKIIDRQGKRFLAKLMEKKYPAPSLLKLMAFRAGRSSMKFMLDDSCMDYRYYQEKGWFDADYYYPVKLNPAKKLSGKFFDMMGVQLAKSN
jgi:multimeric flavodoxin WrbA